MPQHGVPRRDPDAARQVIAIDLEQGMRRQMQIDVNVAPSVRLARQADLGPLRYALRKPHVDRPLAAVGRAHHQGMSPPADSILQRQLQIDLAILLKNKPFAYIDIPMDQILLWTAVVSSS